MFARSAARATFSAISQRNTVLSSADCSSVSGGDNRVFVRPGWDALTITAIAQQSSPPVRAAFRTTSIGIDIRSVISDAAKPIITAILPVTARIQVGDFEGRNPFWHLETEFRGNPQAQRKSIGIGQDLVRVAGGQLGLRMQRRGHVNAARITVITFEADKFRRGIR